MQIDFNNIRLKTLTDYNELVTILNRAICEDIDMNRVIIPVDDLHRILDKMKIDLIMIGCIKDDRIEDCKCIVIDDTNVKEFDPESYI
jgi:predicted polyphosphate/ATP-dependent NAD kinase